MKKKETRSYRRILFIGGEVNAEMVTDLSVKVVQLNFENKTKPIIIVLTSGGGNIECGLGICDILKLSQAPIYTVAQGEVMSMGIPIFCIGKKRYSFENTFFLIHPASWDLGYTDTRDYKPYVDLLTELEDRVVNTITERTDLTLKQTKALIKKQSFFDVEKALEYGIVNQQVLTKKSFWRLIK